MISMGLFYTAACGSAFSAGSGCGDMSFVRWGGVFFMLNGFLSRFGEIIGKNIDQLLDHIKG
jgi:hypothetical protein